MTYTVILEREDEGGFSVYAPALPGCNSQGETEEEALTNIKEAIEGYLVAFKDEPREPRVTIATVEIGDEG